MPTIAPESPAGRPEASQDTRDRTERYAERVDEHLASLAPAKRLPWLLEQQRRWIDLSERFADRIDRGLAPEFGETIFDYTLTICALNERIALEQRKAAVIPTEPNELPAWCAEP